MMPDLGAYGFYVILAYAGSIILLGILLGLSIWQSRRVQRRLTDVEERRGRG